MCVALSTETVSPERAVISNDLVWPPAQMLVCSRAQAHGLCVRHGDQGHGSHLCVPQDSQSFAFGNTTLMTQDGPRSPDPACALPRAGTCTFPGLPLLSIHPSPSSESQPGTRVKATPVPPLPALSLTPPTHLLQLDIAKGCGRGRPAASCPT